MLEHLVERHLPSVSRTAPAHNWMAENLSSFKPKQIWEASKSIIILDNCWERLSFSSYGCKTVLLMAVPSKNRKADPSLTCTLFDETLFPGISWNLTQSATCLRVIIIKQKDSIHFVMYTYWCWCLICWVNPIPTWWNFTVSRVEKDPWILHLQRTSTIYNLNTFPVFWKVITVFQLEIAILLSPLDSYQIPFCGQFPLRSSLRFIQVGWAF
jgi:hypothetical protein